MTAKLKRTEPGQYEGSNTAGQKIMIVHTRFSPYPGPDNTWALYCDDKLINGFDTLAQAKEAIPTS